MNHDCGKCGSLWRRTGLSAPRPVCRVCDEGICAKCDEAKCFRCHAKMHDACSQQYGEDAYCPECVAREVEADLMAALTIEEKLVASVAIVRHRKEMAA